MLNSIKILIRTILLVIAIYSGAAAANSDDVNIEAAVMCAAACAGFVMTKDYIFIIKYRSYVYD